MRDLLTHFLNSIRLKRQHIVLLLLVSFALVVMAVMAVVLTALQTVAVTANALDESRSRQAVSGALSTLKSQMISTMVDYTAWDAAAEAVYSPESKDWVLENFDLANGASEIFDAAYLLGPDGGVLMAFRRGEPFSMRPAEFLSPAFDGMAKAVRRAGVEKGAEAAGFVKTAEGVAIVGVSNIRGLSPDVVVPKDRLQQLVFIRHLDQGRIDSIAENYLITGLRLVDAASVPPGAALVRDPAGRVIAGLTWTAQAPGDISYHRVRPYVLAAMTIVGVFVFLLVLAGSIVIGKLRGDEIAARKMALTDRLSGLGNRLGLFTRLQEMIGQAAGTRDDVMLFYLDMDGFKEVNDVYGHATGDRLIKSVAGGLTHLIPEGAILARLGGDEFAIALPVKHGTRPARSLEVLIQDFFTEPFVLGERVVTVGVSVGTALSPLGSIDAEELLRRADIAMYKAKADGRGRAIAYDAEMDAALAERKSMEAALRAGLRNNEFFVVYQPVVDAKTQRIAGLEALLRWNSRQMGAVSPEIFIPLAESSGLIDKLGMFVMGEALRVIRKWPQIGISINVSPAQFRNPFFIPGVTRLLSESGVSPQSVTLEVTEGYFIHNPGHACGMIDALNGLGLRIALDDFGAGFSSIGYLRQFAFDRLKLDRSMIGALEETPRGREMLQATLALAAALGIPVTAEGIETEEQAIFLRLCGCDQLQGYFFSRPVGEADLPALLGEYAAPGTVSLPA
ncbi:EAL domain-containing protein [Pararhizobium sp. BT-229]|uniref:putative bifunctional diguanylate cyclase/phosphodiesterase n=1 Tax=Pararhizobium sp. BT-229 TaxID=2986923 RepID=UPI0021F7FBA9|nr:EAL domain-containing protein [Pararhizobium sp. BT-229]MCV9966554.1 EAL domain-containing protein [Pararhizobium sp. BT-229]